MTTTYTDSEEMGGPPSPLPQNSNFGDHTNLPSPDFSHRLPTELLRSIFIHIARDSYTDRKYSYSTPTAPSWVNVSYVCSYWQDVALDCPTLWSYIPAMSQRWTEELLARSQMVPLKISLKVTAIRPRLRPRIGPYEVLPVVKKVMKHSQRIQKLHLDAGSMGMVSTCSWETCDQVLFRFLSMHLPCLQYLEISNFDSPEGNSWLLFGENTPALRTLRLKFCSMPLHVLGQSVLTTLHLSFVGICVPDNTMTEFLAMLCRMPHLVRLSVEDSLPSARDFLSNGELDATPTISLPHLSSMSVMSAPLSSAIALFSCVDISFRTNVLLEAWLEYTFAAVTSTLDDYVRLASLLAQRINQSNSPEFRSLTIGSMKAIVLAFSTSQRVEWYSPDSFLPIGSDDDPSLKVNFFSGGPPMNELDFPALSGICSQIPLANIRIVHFLGSSLEPEFWRDMLASLSDVRHIRFSRDKMPNIISVLSSPSHHVTRSSRDHGCTDGGQGEIFVPALEELELYRTTLRGGHGRDNLDPYVAGLQELYDAISTRKETRCRLIIKVCNLVADEGDKVLDSFGWWEGDQFRVISNV